MEFDPFKEQRRLQKLLEEMSLPRQLVKEYAQEHQISKIASKYLEASGARALAKAVQEWKTQAEQNVFATSQQRYLSEAEKMISTAVIPPPEWFERAASMRSVAAQYGSELNRIRDQMLKHSVDYESVMSESKRLAEEVSNLVQQAIPKHYRSDALRLVQSIDFERVRVAAQETRSKLREEQIHDFRNETDGIGDSPDLEKLRSEVKSAVFEAIAAGQANGTLPPASGIRWITVVIIIWHLFELIVDVVGQTQYERYLEREDKARSLRIEQSAPARYVRNDQRWEAEGLLLSTATVNIRLGPQTTQRVLLTVKAGTLLRKKKTKFGWTLVEVVDAPGEETVVQGWIRSKYTVDIAKKIRDEIWRQVNASVTRKFDDSAEND
jgi:hypothetical protein